MKASPFKNWPRLTTKGLKFPVLNLTWLYPWARKGTGAQFLDGDTDTYLTKRSQRADGLVFAGKVKGVHFEDWVQITAPLLEKGTLVLYDIDLSRKPIGFWKYVPKEVRVEFTKDMVILRGDNLEQVKNSIDPDFAKCILL